MFVEKDEREWSPKKNAQGEHFPNVIILENEKTCICAFLQCGFKPRVFKVDRLSWERSRRVLPCLGQKVGSQPGVRQHGNSNVKSIWDTDE